jgi:hypothetical protein
MAINHPPITTPITVMNHPLSQSLAIPPSPQAKLDKYEVHDAAREEEEDSGGGNEDAKACSSFYLYIPVNGHMQCPQAALDLYSVIILACALSCPLMPSNAL